VQTLAEQVAFAERNRMPFPVIADPHLRLREALDLPTFALHGVTYLRRLTLVAEQGVIVKAFYPVFPPDRHAAEVLAWLGSR
jgi:peroxiredoxin